MASAKADEQCLPPPTPQLLTFALEGTVAFAEMSLCKNVIFYWGLRYSFGGPIPGPNPAPVATWCLTKLTASRS